MFCTSELCIIYTAISPAQWPNARSLYLFGGFNGKNRVNTYSVCMCVMYVCVFAFENETRFECMYEAISHLDFERVMFGESECEVQVEWYFRVELTIYRFVC